MSSLLKTSKTSLFWQSIVLALLSFCCYWTFDEMFNEFGLIAKIPMLICLSLLIKVIFQSYIRKFYPPVFIGLTMLISVGSIIFNSRVLLKARLSDDRSDVNLSLRENKTFELNYGYILGSDESYGNYKIIKNKIILQNRSTKDKSFIPDTLTIYKNKVVMHYDKNRDPDTSFARYFEIERNTIVVSN